MRVKVGKVSSPTANVSQVLEKVPENEKVCLCLHSIDEEYIYAATRNPYFTFDILHISHLS